MAEDEVATNGKAEQTEDNQTEPKAEKTTDEKKEPEEKSNEPGEKSDEAESKSHEMESEEKPNPLEEKIIRQIEYYFGDINLSKDKFLQNEIKNDDGWVTIDTMLKFKRLARLSEDPTVVINALAKSTSKLMEISEDKSKIRRSPDKVLPEMNEDRRKELMTRTVYCKGFPKDSVLDDILDFFAKEWKLENLVMRNYQNKSTKTWHFKGSVFAVFHTIEAAEEFLKLESVKYNDNELRRLWQKDYLEEKKNEYLEEKKNRQIKKKEKEEAAEPNTEKKGDDGFPTGTILYMSELKGDISREDIRHQIQGLGTSVAYVDFNKGEKECWVRLDEKDAAKEFVAKLTDGKLTIKDLEVTVKHVQAEEEKAYFSKVKDLLRKQYNNLRNGKRKRKGGRGGGNMRKRKASPSGEGPHQQE